MSDEQLQGDGASRAGRMEVDCNLTIYFVAELKQKLLDGVAGHDVLELDLSRVEEIDTAGIQLLILAKRESLKQGGTLRIVSHSQPVQELIDFYNIAAFFGDPLVISARAVH